MDLIFFVMEKWLVVPGLVVGIMVADSFGSRPHIYRLYRLIVRLAWLKVAV